MTSITRDLRKDLEKTVKQARRIAEAGARQAVQQLRVGDGDAPKDLTIDQRVLRTRLRAHGRQLGDRRDAKSGAQETARLVQECAYEHWHRMLFARFLAETDLLIESESGVAITLDEVQELAREKGTDWLPLASEYAERMLPQIFRGDDLVLDIALPPETRSELEDLLKAVPKAVFEAEDSLGWVYQFWQTEKKEEVNKSEVKIGADELPVVTQLFTEDYMVLFLLHNTLGAWWAGKVLVGNPALAASAASEDELRSACRVGQLNWAYLRFVRDTAEDGTEGPWRPAAGIFDGWPNAAKDITLLDPCMGSGHFLVFALPILVAFRVAEDGLPERDAIDAVLRDNLFGLEVDPRCTQIAAFNLAFAAWKRTGFHVLPKLNLACSGLAIGVTKTEWLRLGERAAALADPGARSDLLGTETTLLNAGVDARIRTGLERMYDLFAKAPWLGSLIDPRRAGTDIFAADFDALEPFLKRALADGSEDLAEMAVAAQGLAKAAELLAKQYVLVTTNVPYLTRNKFDAVLRAYCDANYPNSKGELASVFIEKLIRQVRKSGSAAVVFPQNIFFLGTYKKFRGHLLSHNGIDFIAALGEEAWEAFGKRGPLATLASFTNRRPSSEAVHMAIDVTHTEEIEVKRTLLRESDFLEIAQLSQKQNPDHRILFETLEQGELLGKKARAFQGISPADYPRFGRFFWEIPSVDLPWRYWQGSVSSNIPHGGREKILWFGDSLMEEVEEKRAYIRSDAAWGRRGIVISQMRKIFATLSTGEATDTNVSVILFDDDENIPTAWCYITSEQYMIDLRSIDKKVNITNATLTKVPFDLAHWQVVAAEKYPDGLPRPHSNDPTQWLFNGYPNGAEQPLQVAVARLLGYRWPRQTGSSFMDCPPITEPDGLEGLAVADGIICLTAVMGAEPAEARLNALQASVFGPQWSAARLSALLDSVGFAGRTLDDWLRDGFFEQHCALFEQRPFIWHVWDGRRDGFHALVNYHRLSGPDGEGRRTLEKLIYSYLGDWIDSQRDDQKKGVEGADGRLVAAEHLKTELEKILHGEPPYDIFVRWKPLHEQPIGWEPDINNGVRLNIRPFLTACTLATARRGDSCILRARPKGSEFNYMGKADRGTAPIREKSDFPWFWGWTPENPDFATDFLGRNEFDGNRWNGLHYSRGVKEAARDSHRAPAGGQI
ncbi:MAG TPA: N-6 DNA methylase [Candidatus Binataceae bacterium]|nr:N-6 DNA methylase [Candidatus Binataceae bacterium]